MGYRRNLIEDPDHPGRLIDTKDGSIVDRSDEVRRFEDSFDYNGKEEVMAEVKNHGEPTNFDFIVAILLLLLFGLMWSVAEKDG